MRQTASTPRRAWLQALILAPLLGCAAAVMAQTPYPAKTVRIVTPVTPGNTSEVALRYLAKQMQQATGQSFVVDNKPGGNNVIGAQAVSSAPADGYTLFFASNGVMAAAVPAYKNLGYDPVKDFTPIGLALKSPWVLAVGGNSPYKTIEDLIAAGRANPQLLSAGTGSPGYQMAVALFAKETGAPVNIIPYKGTGPAMADAAGGQLTMVVADAGAIKTLSSGGKLRALAALGEERSSLFPDVPTLKERGFPAISLFSWAGLFAPAKTPPAVTARLAALLAEAVRSEEFRRYVSESGGDIASEGPQQLATFQKAQIDAYRDAMVTAGIEAQ